MPNKVDPVRAWLFAEKEEYKRFCERVEHASEEELDRMMREVGLDPSDTPSLEELIRRGEARKREREALRKAEKQAKG